MISAFISSQHSFLNSLTHLIIHIFQILLIFPRYSLINLSTHLIMSFFLLKYLEDIKSGNKQRFKKGKKGDFKNHCRT